jgi:hypothetical protein
LDGLPIVLLGTPGGVLEKFVDFGVECVVEAGDQVLEPLTTQFAVVLAPSCVDGGYFSKFEREISVKSILTIAWSLLCR